MPRVPHDQITRYPSTSRPSEIPAAAPAAKRGQPFKPSGSVRGTTAVDHRRHGDRGSPDDAAAFDVHLPTSRVADRYGCSVRTVERWGVNERLQFPKPDLVINARKYWRLSTLESWERRRAVAAAS